MVTINSVSETSSVSTSTEYNSILKLVHDPVIIFNPISNLILEVNDTACKTYKIKRELFIGLPINHLWVDSFRESEMFGVLFEKGWINNFETTHRRSDGFQMNIVVNASIVELNGRKAIVSVNQNVTEQRRAEEGIKMARIEWRETIDTVRDMIIVEDGNGKIRRCNKAAADFLNLPFEKILGYSMRSLFSPAINKNNKEEKSFEDLQDELEHLRLRKWEGKFRGFDEWFEVNNRQVRSELRSETYWVHVVRNITERKNVEEQLRKFFTVVEQAASQIFITDINVKIQYVNNLVEEISGNPREYFLGRTIFETKPAISKLLFTKEIIPTLSKNNVWRKISKIKRDAEEFFEEITVSKVKDDKEKVFNYVFICRDVTETRQLESIAEAVNMMDNVGYIFSGIRHELGNPINSVKMALTVLEKNLEKWDKEQVNVYIKRCMSEISRVEYLLRALKSFSLHEHPKMEKVSLENFLENFISITKEDFEKRGIEICLSSINESGEVLCDWRALHQILLNLIANAADALHGRKQPKITISLNKVKNRFQVTIEDNGIGMNEKQLGNLFKPFYTSKQNGTGLGLVIVHKMLVRMNGTIFVKSKTDVGTCVSFTLEAATENQ